MSLIEHTFPDQIPYSGIKPIKQMELYLKWRKLVPPEFQDEICPRPKDLEAEIFLIKHGTCFRFPKPRQGTLIRDSGFKSVSLIILHSNIWRTHMTLLNFTESLNSGIHL